MNLLPIELTKFNGCYNELLRSKEINSDEAMVMFHGYPCSTIADTKNRDIAEVISLKTGIDVYVFHHEGLGKSSGCFSFIKSIFNGQEYLKKISSKYKKIHVFGHSWGGLVALNSIHKIKNVLGNVFLISPFTNILSGKNLEVLCTTVYNETKESIPNMDLQDMISELSEIALKYNPIDRDYANTTNQIFLIQAVEDNEVPVEMNRKFRDVHTQAIQEYIEILDDHNFNNSRAFLGEYVSRKIG